MKKWYTKIICLSMLFIMVLSSGCYCGSLSFSTFPPVKTEAEGDFLLTKNDYNEYLIYDLSKQGLNKEYIVVPETIRGNDAKIYPYNGGTVFRNSSKLKKVYLSYEIFVANWNSALENNRKKATIFYEDKSFTINRGIMLCGNSFLSVYKGARMFYSCMTFKKHFKDNVWYALERSDTTNYKSLDYLLANITFMYNYQDSPNEGCFWIDDLETGETLNYIPTPTRDGYTFGGWYADSECTMPYDFTLPHIKKPLKEGSYEWLEEKNGQTTNTKEYYLYYPEDYVTYIYAKWI